MKKLFIGLLIVAAGAAIFFLLENISKPVAAKNFQQEQIIGQWKLDSFLFSNGPNDDFMLGLTEIVDSNLRKYHYQFTRDGALAFSLGDSLIKNSSRFEWNNDNHLVWKHNATDTSGDVFKVSLLNSDSLVVQSKDSSVLLLTKVK